MSKITKTEKFINILHEITSNKSQRISEKKLNELLGNPPLSTWYKLIAELTNGTANMPAILVKLEDSINEYGLNLKVWSDFIHAIEEGYFFLEAYKRLGRVIDCESIKTSHSFAQSNNEINNLNFDRKFYYLSKIEINVNETFQNVLNNIVDALIKNRQLKISYMPGYKSYEIERIIEPLTLCQYRDDLYIICFKIEDEHKERRSYKLSRIKNIEILDQEFEYPDKRTWNPEKTYQNSSGIIIGNNINASIRVFGNARQIFKEKSFFNNELKESTDEYDQYNLKYTDESEFLGQLFVYAQDIEVLDPKELKDHFIEKASTALDRHKINLKVVKKVA